MPSFVPLNDDPLADSDSDTSVEETSMYFTRSVH